MSDPQHLVAKLWNYCRVLRDDGLSYGDYVEQLTFLLFLKIAVPKARAWCRLSAVDEHEATVTTDLHRTTRLRQAILKNALSGGLAKCS